MGAVEIPGLCRVRSGAGYEACFGNRARNKGGTAFRKRPFGYQVLVGRGAFFNI